MGRLKQVSLALLTAGLLANGVAQAAGTWETTLLGRDINGAPVDGSSSSAVFLYDTDLDITWLRNANMNGNRDWDTAKTWANNLTIGTYIDWRLPANNACFDYNCTGSEMGHLWYVALGNPAHGPMTSTGDFQNLQSPGSGGYWLGTEYSTRYAWYFSTTSGFQGSYLKTYALYALAVHPGDVLAVPEPETYAMLLAGLGLLGVVTRGRKPKLAA